VPESAGLRSWNTRLSESAGRNRQDAGGGCRSTPRIAALTDIENAIEPQTSFAAAFVGEKARHRTRSG